MFNLVNNLRSELMGFPAQPIPASLSERTQVVKQVINQLYKSAVPGNQTEIAASPSSTLHYSDYAGLTSEVKFSPLLLLASEEIPARFRFNGPDDPRLNDDEQLINDYSNWICKKLEIPVPGFLSQFSESYYNVFYDKKILKSNLQFMQDPQNAKKAIKFMLLHELGHVYQNDMGVRTIVDALIKGVSISWPICLAFALSWPLSFSISFVLIAGGISVYVLNFLSQHPLCRYQESRADAFAAKSGRDVVDGGLYFLSTVLNENKKELAERLASLENSDSLLKGLLIGLNKLYASPEGENNLDFAHPTIASRISALQASRQSHAISLDYSLART